MKEWFNKTLSNTLFKAALFGVLGLLVFELPSISESLKQTNLSSPSLKNGRLMTMPELAKAHGTVRNPHPTMRNEEAAAAIENYFIKRYSTPTGPHLESVLSALGASAGFGCQMAIREAFIKTGKVSEARAFVVAQGRDGKKYYFGDFLNQPLLNTNQISVWTLVAGGAVKAGATTDSLPDVSQIIKHTASTVGGQQFGRPQLPANHYPKELPAEALRASWNEVEAIERKYQIDPQFWGWIPAEAAQNAILHYKDKIDPALAATIVMEAALPMSKVDPATAIAEK